MNLCLAALKRILQCRQRRLSSASSGLPLIVGSSPELVQRLGSQVEVRPAFITEEEEAALLEELEPGLKKKRYEFDHWDDVSHRALLTRSDSAGFDDYKLHSSPKTHMMLGTRSHWADITVLSLYNHCEGC